ncbi:MAG: type VI secretion system contractile sheath small subunit [Verrucomicrobiae bacterium]|nr:type VI secretion system contractile sheath small subunit [Verrucomicrobiae bacterium]
MPLTIAEFIKRNRPPRVHIQYKPDINGPVLVDLPFVLGVMANLTGEASETHLVEDEKRKFIEIDKDNFETVLKKTAPKVCLKVDNKLGGSDSRLAVELTFKKMDDFSPAAIAQAVPELKAIYDKRQALNEIKNSPHRIKKVVAGLTKKDNATQIGPMLNRPVSGK